MTLPEVGRAGRPQGGTQEAGPILVWKDPSRVRTCSESDRCHRVDPGANGAVGLAESINDVSVVVVVTFTIPTLVA